MVLKEEFEQINPIVPILERYFHLTATSNKFWEAFPINK